MEYRREDLIAQAVLDRSSVTQGGLSFEPGPKVARLKAVLCWDFLLQGYQICCESQGFSKRRFDRYKNVSGRVRNIVAQAGTYVYVVRSARLVVAPVLRAKSTGGEAMIGLCHQQTDWLIHSFLGGLAPRLSLTAC